MGKLSVLCILFRKKDAYLKGCIEHVVIIEKAENKGKVYKKSIKITLLAVSCFRELIINIQTFSFPQNKH